MTNKNHEGYMDPTAYGAMSAMERDTARLNRLLRDIFDTCGEHGFKVLNRIVLKDLETGKVWR